MNSINMSYILGPRDINNKNILKRNTPIEVGKTISNSNTSPVLNQSHWFSNHKIHN